MNKINIPFNDDTKMISIIIDNNKTLYVPINKIDFYDNNFINIKLAYSYYYVNKQFTDFRIYHNEWFHSLTFYFAELKEIPEFIKNNS